MFGKLKKWLSCMMILIFSVILLPTNAFAADETDNSGIISGKTYVITSKNSGKAMEVANFGTQNGDKIQQWDYGNGTSQQWIIEQAYGKYYKIISKNSSKVVDVKDMSTENGATIHQWDYVNGDNQLWYFEKTDDGYFKIKSKQSNKCIDIAAISSDNGALMQLWEDVNGDNQKWNIKDITDDLKTNTNCTYKILNKSSNKALQVASASSENGALIEQWDENNTKNQSWKIENVSDKYFKIINDISGKVLDIKDLAQYDGATVHLWEDVSGDNQLWYFEKTDDGYYKIKSKRSNKCLDVAGISKDNGAKMQLWSDVNGDNQKWKITAEKIDFSKIDYTKDSDNDGIADDLEDILGLSKSKDDSDGDGIPDKVEINMYPYADPTKYDTAGDGIADIKKDFDEDKLTTEEELELGTDPIKADTDDDGLNDYDEVYVYKTNPTVADTDGDGINDGDEISLGSDPLKADTDGNGISDNEENYTQTVSQDCDNQTVSNVEVTLDAKGSANGKIKIKDLEDKDKTASNVVGLVGNPINISCKCEFNKAELKFTYDEGNLGDTKAEDLDVLWYDKENSTFRLMNATVDEENSTVTIETTHFSEYMLVDKSKWFDNWRNKIDYRSDTKGYFDLAFVIDGSGSMENNDPLKLRIEATKSFIDSFKDKDKGAVIEFENRATLYQGLTSDKTLLKAAADKIPDGGGTNLGAGVKCALDELETNGTNENRTVILLTDGQGDYDNSLNARAVNDKAKIYTVALGSSTNESLLKSISFATGGEYYKATTSEELIATFEKVRDTSTMDETDTDGDGLPDIVETLGMKTLNGQVIKTDPYNSDTDGDGISDGEEMGEAMTFIVPEEYKEYIDSYTYYPMYSNPLINSNDENDATGDEDWDEEDDNEIDITTIDLTDYIPNSVTFIFNKLGIDIKSALKETAFNIKELGNFDLEKPEDVGNICAGILAGIDDCRLFGIVDAILDYSSDFWNILNFSRARVLTNLAFLIHDIGSTVAAFDTMMAGGVSSEIALFFPPAEVATLSVTAVGAIECAGYMVLASNDVSKITMSYSEFDKKLNIIGSQRFNEKPSHITLNDKQLGKKWGKHKYDYTNLKTVEEYKKLANEVFNNPDKIVYDNLKNEYYYISGDNLLRLKSSGEFVSLYHGSNSERILKAIKKGGLIWQKH